MIGQVLTVPLLVAGLAAVALLWPRRAQAAVVDKPTTKAPPEPGQAHPRGIRNNNPGNIRTRGTRNGIGGADPWKGLVGEDDAGYGIFSEPLYGLRAMFRELGTGYARGERTIRQIISQWAPSSENDTAAYIAAVSAGTGIPADLELTRSDFTAMVKAIIRHENGRQPYPDELLAQARALA